MKDLKLIDLVMILIFALALNGCVTDGSSDGNSKEIVPFPTSDPLTEPNSAPSSEPSADPSSAPSSAPSASPSPSPSPSASADPLNCTLPATDVLRGTNGGPVSVACTGANSQEIASMGEIDVCQMFFGGPCNAAGGNNVFVQAVYNGQNATFDAIVSTGTAFSYPDSVCILAETIYSNGYSPTVLKCGNVIKTDGTGLEDL